VVYARFTTGVVVVLAGIVEGQAVTLIQAATAMMRLELS